MKMIHRKSLIVVLFVLCFQFLFAETEPPNIIVIIADDLAFEDLGCYGGKLPTPHIDRLANEGARFTRHYSAAPVCTPSRYAILTGKIPSRAKSVEENYPVDQPPMIRWNAMIDRDDRTLAHHGHANGYRSAYIGKWHNGDPEFLEHVPQAAPADFAKIQPALRRNYTAMQATVRERSGFETTEGLYTTNVSWMPLPGSLMGHHQHWLTHETVKVIEQDHEHPFCLYHATTIPHPPNTLDSLENSDPRATTRGLSKAHVNIQPNYASILERTNAHGPYAAEYNAFAEPYSKSEAAGTIWLDDAVGRILQALEDTKKLDNTLILFASDHARQGKMVLNAGPCPLIIWYPKKIPAGQTIDAIVSNVDFIPTLIETMGQSTAPNNELDGVSLWPLLTGGAKKVRDHAYMEITYTRGVVTDKWKYIATRFPPKTSNKINAKNRRTFNQEGKNHSPGNPNGKKLVRYNSHYRFPGYFDDDQLYDLENDPRQQTNLAKDPKHLLTLEKMKSHLSDYCQNLPHTFGEFKQK